MRRNGTRHLLGVLLVATAAAGTGRELGAVDSHLTTVSEIPYEPDVNTDYQAALTGLEASSPPAR